MTDIRERVSGMKSWTAVGPDKVHTYSLKKLTALNERLAAQMKQLLMDSPRVANPRVDGPDHEGLPDGRNSMQLLANSLSVYNTDAPVRHHSS